MRQTPPGARLRLVALLAAPLTAAGCAAGYGFGAGLLVDTRGQIGAVVSARMSIGAAVDHRRGVAETIGAEAGSAANFRAGDVGPIAGLDYVAEPDDGGPAWRLGARGRPDLRFTPQGHTFGVGAGAAFALLDVLEAQRRDYTNFGAELQAYAVTVLGHDPPPAMYGLFILSAVWETWTFTELDDFFERH
jgi:hypothetical protein